MISFTVTAEESLLISNIVNKYINMFSVLGNANKKDKDNVMMAITACHANGCPLDLQKLLNADDYNFAPDMIGIRNNIDRHTGKLLNCFLPRCSA
jgi:hypothetical protein